MSLFTIGFGSGVTRAATRATATTARSMAKKSGDSFAFANCHSHHVDSDVCNENLVDQWVLAVPIVETGRQQVVIRRSSCLSRRLFTPVGSIAVQVDILLIR